LALQVVNGAYPPDWAILIIILTSSGNHFYFSFAS